MGILGGSFGEITDYFGWNIFRNFGRQCDEVVGSTRQQASEVLQQTVQEANELIDRLDEVIGRAIKKLILGLLFLLLILVGAYFGAIFAYQYFFVDVDMDPEEISFEFTAIDHAYFAIKHSIVFAYDQSPCASTLLSALFGLIFPCLFSGLLVFTGNNNNVPRRPIRPMARGHRRQQSMARRPRWR